MIDFITKDLNDKFINDNLLQPHSLQHKTYIERTDHGDQKFKCEFQVGDFKSNDFRLKLFENKLTVQAFKQNCYTNNLIDHQDFKREISLPDFVDKETVSCYLESYENIRNVLIVEAFIHPGTLIDENFIQKEKIYSDYFAINNQNTTSTPKTAHVPHINDHSLNNGYLKYKFDLSDYEPRNVSISVKNKSILHINAFKKILDANRQPVMQEFNHEIKMPSNVEYHNIKNCFDELDGMLRIEIPVAGVHDRKSGSGDKYLELMFDLYDFKFDGIKVYLSDEGKKILEVKAVKLSGGKPLIRKYVLPEWAKDENINVLHEKQNLEDKARNLLIVQLPIVD